MDLVDVSSGGTLPRALIAVGPGYQVMASASCSTNTNRHSTPMQASRLSPFIAAPAHCAAPCAVVFKSSARPPAGPQVPFAERIRSDVGLPTAAVGLITGAQQAEAILREGEAQGPPPHSRLRLCAPYREADMS